MNLEREGDEVDKALKVKTVGFGEVLHGGLKASKRSRLIPRLSGL